MRSQSVNILPWLAAVMAFLLYPYSADAADAGLTVTCQQCEKRCDKDFTWGTQAYKTCFNRCNGGQACSAQNSEERDDSLKDELDKLVNESIPTLNQLNDN